MKLSFFPTTNCFNHVFQPNSESNSCMKNRLKKKVWLVLTTIVCKLEKIRFFPKAFNNIKVRCPHQLQTISNQTIAVEFITKQPGLTLRGYLSKILVRSWKILTKIFTRSCHGINFAMVRSYQESHVPKRILL